MNANDTIFNAFHAMANKAGVTLSPIVESGNEVWTTFYMDGDRVTLTGLLSSGYCNVEVQREVRGRRVKHGPHSQAALHVAMRLGLPEGRWLFD